MNALSQSFQNLGSWFNKQLFIEKLNNPLGYLIIAFLAVGIALTISMFGLKAGAILFGAGIGLPILALCFINLQFGVNIIMFVAIFVLAVSKYVDLPFGIALDALLFTMFLGLVVRQIRDRDLSFANSPVSVIIILWVILNLIQVINPVAASRMAWLYTVRSMAGLIFLYFIACYAFTSFARIKMALKVFLGLSFASALYGLKQEYIGFTSGEMNWLHADEERFQLIFQWARLRVFSFFSDPTNLGICMSYAGMVCFILATGPFKKRKKLVLMVAGLCMFYTMALAGSRTPFVLIPFGVLIVLILTLKKEFIIGTLLFFVAGSGLIFKSTNNAVIYRIQSAFDSKTSGDTMDVRFSNQKMIQPLIQSHPFGAGLGSTGGWGKRFSPNSFLASFAHDSGFVRIAVELGWVGLFVYCVLLYVVLHTGIYYYLRVKNPQIKVIYLALTVMMFMLTLANYPQEAIVQLPNSIFFYVCLAILVKAKDFDENFQKPQRLSIDSKNENFEEAFVINEDRIRLN